jgi:hypothetical protein
MVEVDFWGVKLSFRRAECDLLSAEAVDTLRGSL